MARVRTVLALTIVAIAVLQWLPGCQAEPLSLEKTVVRTYYFLPNGSLTESTVYVTIKLSGWGTVDLEDNLALVNPSSLRFYGTTPSRVDTLGSLTRIVWTKVDVNGRRVIVYSAKPLTSVVSLLASIKVNGSKVVPKCDHVCTIRAGVGSVVELEFVLRNELVLNGTRVPLFVGVMLTLDTNSLALDGVKPAATLSPLGETLVLSWGFILENETSLYLKLRIKSVNEWSEAPLPSLRLTVSLDPSRTLETLREAEEQLKKTLEALSAVESLANASRRGLLDVINMLENMSDNLAEYEARLHNASIAAYETAEVLGEASKVAANASEGLASLAELLALMRDLKSETTKYQDVLSEVSRTLENMTNDIESYEALFGQEIADKLYEIRSRVSEAETTLTRLDKVLSKVDVYASSAKESTVDLKRLAELLDEGSQGMRKLGDALSSVREKVLELKGNLTEYVLLLRQREDEINGGLNRLLDVKQRLIDELEKVGRQIAALQALASLYESERPRAYVNGQAISGLLISDEVSISLPSIRAISPKSIELAKEDSSCKRPSENSHFLALLAALLLAIPSARLVTYRKTDPSLNTKVEELERKIEKLKKALKTS